MKRLLVILLTGLLIMTAGCGAAPAPQEDTEASEGLEQENDTMEESSALEEGQLPPEEELVYEPLPESALPMAQRLPGDWYGDYQGLVLTLTLTEEGDYTFAFPGEEVRQGKWEINEDGLLDLGGEAGDVMLPDGDSLYWEAGQVVFTREAIESYVPAALYTEAQEGDLDGYWKSHFVAIDDQAILASSLGEKTDLYIDGTRVALGGPLFGDVIVDMEMEDGALHYASGELSVTLGLQEDGLLRLSAENAGEEIILYLLPAYSENFPPKEEPQE